MFLLSLQPDVHSNLLSVLDPAPLQALRCTCRLFRDAVTLDMCDQSVARAVARYARATTVHTGFRACMIRLHSQYGQHVAEFRLWSDENSSVQHLTLLLDGMEFEGCIRDWDRKKLLKDLPVWMSSVDVVLGDRCVCILDGDRRKFLKDLPVWMSSVDVVLRDRYVFPRQRSSVNMRIHVGNSTKDYEFYVPKF